MAALDFPDTPTIGQLYGSSGTVWRWDGARWASTAGASGARGRVAYGQALANQSGIVGTIVDITGVSATWVADPTRTYLITAVADLYSTVAGDVGAIFIANATGAQLKRTSHPLGPAASTAVTHTAVCTVSGISGAQTAKMTAVRIAGTGTLATYAAPGNPAFILVEDITYEAGSSGTPAPTATPAVSVGMIGGQDVGTSVGSKLGWQTKYWGPSPGMWAGTGGSALTAPIAGMYLVQAQVRMAQGQTGGDTFLYITANNGPNNWARVSVSNVTATAKHLSCSAPIALSAGGYVEAWIFQNTGATMHVDGDSTLGACSNFSLTYMGPPAAS